MIRIYDPSKITISTVVGMWVGSGRVREQRSLYFAYFYAEILRATDLFFLTKYVYVEYIMSHKRRLRIRGMDSELYASPNLSPPTQNRLGLARLSIRAFSPTCD